MPCPPSALVAVAAALHLRGTDTGESAVAIPGGRVSVTVGKGVSTLTGPAEFVAKGELDRAWWEALG